MATNRNTTSRATVNAEQLIAGTAKHLTSTTQVAPLRSSFAPDQIVSKRASAVVCRRPCPELVLDESSTGHKLPFTSPAEALAHVRGYAAASRVRFGRHARERMGERGASVEHVLSALRNAASCTPGGDRWKATGPDLDGDSLTAVVVIEDGLIVVTVF